MPDNDPARQAFISAAVDALITGADSIEIVQSTVQVMDNLKVAAQYCAVQANALGLTQQAMEYALAAEVAETTKQIIEQFQPAFPPDPEGSTQNAQD